MIGFAAINISRAGEGVHLPPVAGAAPLNAVPHTAAQLITDIFPENIAKSVAEGQVLQVVVFSILFAMALALVPEPKRRPMLAFAESLSETMFKFTNLVMYAAPIGVFGAIAYTVGHLGLGVLLPLLKLLATMYVALIVFIVGVLLPIALLVKTPLKEFLRAVTEPVTIAFATASSEAALPRAMEEMEAFGVPRETVAFVLAYWLQLQSGRIEFVSGAGAYFCGAGGGDSSDDRAADGDDADFVDQQQRDGGRGEGFARDCVWLRRLRFICRRSLCFCCLGLIS